MKKIIEKILKMIPNKKFMFKISKIKIQDLKKELKK